MKIQFTLLLIVAYFISAVAQIDPEIPEIKDTSVKGQFETLYNTSNNYKEFKVIKRTLFLNLQKNTLDSLKTIENKLAETQSKISKLNEQISQTKTSLNATNGKLAAATNEIDSISFLGQLITKQSFKSITGGLFIGLLALLAFFIFKYKKSNAITKNALSSLTDVEREFEDHRRRALEREQVVMRKLQDEINKHK